MSVIHEALRRAERERSSVLIPKVALAGAAPAAPRLQRRHGVVAALGVTVLLLFGAYWARHRDRPREMVSEPGALTTVPPPSPDPLVRPATVCPPEPVPAVPAVPAVPTVPTVPAVPAVPAPAPTADADADAEPGRLNSQAVSSFREGRMDESRRLLEQVLRNAPAMPEAHNNLGMVLQAQGNRAAAREEYFRALALAPGYPEALNNLGLLWSGEGNQGEALRSFEKALSSRPGYGAAHLNIAIVYDKLGRRADAFGHYRRFLENAGENEKELIRRVNDRLRR